MIDNGNFFIFVWW